MLADDPDWYGGPTQWEVTEWELEQMTATWVAANPLLAAGIIKFGEVIGSAINEAASNIQNAFAAIAPQVTAIASTTSAYADFVSKLEVKHTDRRYPTSRLITESRRKRNL